MFTRKSSLFLLPNGQRNEIKYRLELIAHSFNFSSNHTVIKISVNFHSLFLLPNGHLLRFFEKQIKEGKNI